MTRRTALVIAGLAAVLLVLMLSTTGTAPRGSALFYSYSSTDPGPGGAMLLRRWLAALGYQTSSVQGERFAIPSDLDVLFVLGPTELVRRQEAERLRDWVDCVP